VPSCCRGRIRTRISPAESAELRLLFPLRLRRLRGEKDPPRAPDSGVRPTPRRLPATLWNDRPAGVYYVFVTYSCPAAPS
jgi:hypothetical protein